MTFLKKIYSFCQFKGGRVIEKLDSLIRAGRRKFDIMHEDKKSNGNGSREISLDVKNTCPSPASPTSIGSPKLMKLSSFSDVSNTLPPLLQAVEKCISSNILSNNGVSGKPESVINPETDKSGILARREKEAFLPLAMPSTSPTNVPSASPNSMLSQVPRVPSTLSPRKQQANRTAPAGPPPPPPRAENQTAPTGPPPPPPPGAGGSRFMRLMRSDSKLRRSSHMGNLYRALKRKLEGSSNASGPTTPCKTRPRIGGAFDAKQGMADALAEMAKRSAYFLQIEEDIQKHSEKIMQVKDAINSFKTKDMAELVKFHGQMEQHLEQLTDETQVLARFEGFPTKKLEILRTAAALHLKLEGIALNLRNWKINPPVGQLLDKVESYFNKIKGEIEAVERSKDEDSKHFRSHDIEFDFKILNRIKELMVDVSSGSMELALKERREAEQGKRLAHVRMLWRAFQLAFRVYTFAGGQDDRADRLTRELGRVLDAIPQNQ